MEYRMTCRGFWPNRHLIYKKPSGQGSREDRAIYLISLVQAQDVVTCPQIQVQDRSPIWIGHSTRTRSLHCRRIASLCAKYLVTLHGSCIHVGLTCNNIQCKLLQVDQGYCSIQQGQNDPVDFPHGTCVHTGPCGPKPRHIVIYIQCRRSWQAAALVV